MDHIDFTKTKRIFGKAYNGAGGNKIAIEYEGEVYMLKFPPSGKGKLTTLSYTNSCFSEHIASTIFRMLGIRAQETMLGTFEVTGKTKIVCACKDFTTDGKILYDFCSIKNTVIASDSGGTGTELSDILESIDGQLFIDPTILREHFWNMFVVDAFLGNFDRHNGNWGFLYDPVSEAVEIAPVFDCGSCLLPQADEATMKKVLTIDEEMDARIFQFPVSAIKERGKKINYYNFLMKGHHDGCDKALMQIVPRIDMDKIWAFLDEVPYLTDLQRTFYKTYLKARWGRLLLPAHEKAMARKSAHSAA